MDIYNLIAFISFLSQPNSLQYSLISLSVVISLIASKSACFMLGYSLPKNSAFLFLLFVSFIHLWKNTFFDSFEKEATHTSLAEPFDANLRNTLYHTSVALGYPTHPSGTVVTIEGPRFSTRAESHMFRAWGADIVNMSIAPEAMLANEAGIPYAAVAMSTDYDCWKEDEAPVSWEEILEVFNQNAESVKRLLIHVIPKIK